MFCGECGSRVIKKTNIKGRKLINKGFKEKEVVKDLYLYVCQGCNNIITTSGDNKLIDESTEK